MHAPPVYDEHVRETLIELGTSNRLRSVEFRLCSSPATDGPKVNCASTTLACPSIFWFLLVAWSFYRDERLMLLCKSMSYCEARR